MEENFNDPVLEYVFKSSDVTCGRAYVNRLAFLRLFPFSLYDAFLCCW